MPKLDGTHIVERLRDRLAALRRGEEVAARDLRVLLTPDQIAALDAAWAEQQALRKAKRARTKDEERQLGWRSKRELHVEALEGALRIAEDGEVEAWTKLQRDAEVRQARTYMDAYIAARNDGKTRDSASAIANNALTRAGLNRLDARGVGGMTARDREVRELEQRILQDAEAKLSDDEREQRALLKAHDAGVAGGAKKKPGR